MWNSKLTSQAGICRSRSRNRFPAEMACANEWLFASLGFPPDSLSGRGGRGISSSRCNGREGLSWRDGEGRAAAGWAGAARFGSRDNEPSFGFRDRCGRAGESASLASACLGAGAASV